MKYYFSKKGVHLLSITPENIGYTKADFLNGKLIELPEDKVQLAESFGAEPMDSAYDMLYPKYYYYIKSGRVLAMTEPLNVGSYKIGTSFEDYLRGEYVLLSDEQSDFYLAHKGWKIELIWNMQETPEYPAEPELTLEMAKAQKLAELNRYDNSDAVNQFLVNGGGAWFTPAERTSYASSVSAAKTLSVENLSFYVGENVLTVPTAMAEQMLAAVQLYADAAFMVTRAHAAAIEKLETIEDVEAYDFTQGYPEKLQFNV